MAIVILDFRLVDGKNFIRILTRVADVHTVGVPHEILEQFIRILLLNYEASSLDDVAAVLNELATRRGELVMIWYGRAVENDSQGSVNLLVGGITPLAESLYDAIESELKGTGRQRRDGIM